ncbi:DNA methyltransferase [Roseibium sp. M-1]
MDLARLNRIDWDFPGTGTHSGTPHAFHWFPGNYIPQLPTAFIQVLSKPGEVVLDPFCGSGTTALAAMALNRDAVVSDQLKSSLLITRAKVTLARSGFDRTLRDKLLAKLAFDHECRTTMIGEAGEGSDPELEAWYSADTLSQLRFLWKLVETISGDQRCILNGVFSDVLFQCTSTRGSLTRSGKRRRHHWGWIADNVKPTELVNHDAIALFRSSIAQLSEIPTKETKSVVQVQQQDARCMSFDDEITDLVVTSPPYIGMIDYTHASRMEYLWMGWAILEERELEIGARYRRNRRSRLKEEYIADMTRCAAEISRTLRRNRHCALVLGESRAFPGTALSVIDIFAEFMPLVWGPVPRTPTRRRVSDRSATESVEYLAVFQKP